MEAIGHSWPEQNAVDAWIEEIGVPVGNDERLALKKAVTEERLRQMNRAEAAESRVKELEQTVVDMRDRVILERERREQAEAACAAMRKALESIADWNDDRSPEGIYRAIEIADQALSTTAGRDYVERLKKLELVAEAVREYRDYAWKPYNHRTFSQEVLGSLKKRVCDSLTALDGDGNG